jgi:PAS domain S-box-containing protein
MLNGEKIHLFETKRLTKDGRILPVQLSSTIYHDRNGQPTGNIVTLRDISALKKAETVKIRSFFTGTTYDASSVSKIKR